MLWLVRQAIDGSCKHLAYPLGRLEQVLKEINIRLLPPILV